MKKQYRFARLFVRSAKGIAVLVTFIGIGFCVLRYYQASIAASAVTYKSSRDLQQALDKLKDEFLSTQQIVDSFNSGNESTTPGVQGPRFPLVIESADDFTAIAAELSRLDQDRQRLKESVVGRFETLVKGIEEKLHDYAAALQPSPSPAAVKDVSAVAVPEPPAEGPDDSLFSPKLNSSEAHERKLNLTERKEFLKTLGTKAENAENRVILNEAADQIERLAKLLPENFNASATAARLDFASNAPDQPRSEQSNKVLPSERAARQLERLRSGVRQMLLTSWTLDEAFDQATNLISAEREKFRVATMTQQGVWLSATSPIVIGLLATGLASLVILVFGDLVSTQLDTATNSGTVADAINALRGSVAHVPGSEPTNSEPNIKTEYAKPVTGEESPIAGGS